jgi:UDP-hydrolysing UDP-N-acetyl-D-glucosamine 2-epimerase
MKHVCVAITARPSYSRVRSALAAMQADPGLRLSVVCSGSALLDRYGRVVDNIRADGFDVVEELYTFVEGGELVNMAATTANTISGTAQTLTRLKPDYVVSIADRYETIGTAIAASYCGFPLVHVQGGEVTGNIDERVRHAVTKLSDLHMVANEEAARRVRQLGEHPDTIHVTGCPSLDIVDGAMAGPLSEVQQAVDTQGVGAHVDLSEPFIVLLQHPETDSHGASYERMCMTLHALDSIGLPVLVFWPNVDAGSDATSKAIRVVRENGLMTRARYNKNLDGRIFLRLLKEACCLVGNSSVGVRECSLMGVPVVNIGDRQIGRARGANVRDTVWDQEVIATAVREQVAHGRYPADYLYGDGGAGARIARILSTGPVLTPKRFQDA